MLRGRVYASRVIEVLEERVLAIHRDSRLEVETDLAEDLSSDHAVFLALVQDEADVANILALGSEPVVLLLNVPSLFSLFVRVERESLEVLTHAETAPDGVFSNMSLTNGTSRVVAARAGTIAGIRVDFRVAVFRARVSLCGY